MNKPYVKKYDENGNCVNEITKDNPFKNVSVNRQQRNQEGIYLILTNGDKIKTSGNNRKPCKRTGMPRNYNK
jgi:hypothetical protein